MSICRARRSITANSERQTQSHTFTQTGNIPAVKWVCEPPHPPAAAHKQVLNLMNICIMHEYVIKLLHIYSFYSNYNEWIVKSCAEFAPLSNPPEILPLRLLHFKCLSFECQALDDGLFWDGEHSGDCSSCWYTESPVLYKSWFLENHLHLVYFHLHFTADFLPLTVFIATRQLISWDTLLSSTPGQE